MSGQLHFQAGEPRQFAQGKIDDLFFRCRIASNDDLGWLASAQVEHHLRCKIQTRQHEGWVDTTFEAIARVRIDSELSSGLGNIEFVPQRRFDQDVRGGFRTTGRLAAHDAGKGLNGIFIGDDANALIKRISLAVEGEQLLAIPRATNSQVAMHLCRVEHMQRSSTIKGHEIGYVDERVDGPQSDCG